MKFIGKILAYSSCTNIDSGSFAEIKLHSKAASEIAELLVREANKRGFKIFSKCLDSVYNSEFTITSNVAMFNLYADGTMNLEIESGNNRESIWRSDKGWIAKVTSKNRLKRIWNYL